MKTKQKNITWNLSLLYKDLNDPQIEKDIQVAEKVYATFAQKYSENTTYLTEESELLSALTDYETLYGELDTEKPIRYFMYRTHLNSADVEAEAKLTALSQRYSELSNKILFFPIALSRISKDKQEVFLKSESLKKFTYFLQQIFDHAKYVLSEPEEKILNLKNLPAHELWVRGNEKLLGKQEIKWKGKKMPLTEAGGILSSLPTKDRHTLGALISTQLKSLSDFAESELNAVVTDKKIEDQLRGYEKPYSATILGYQNEPETVERLVQTVTKHFPIAHRFYAVKAKMLGLKKLTYADRSAQVAMKGVKKRAIPFDEAVEIVKAGLGKVGNEYEKTFHEFLVNGQIDVFPRKGKHGGAYCSSGRNMPTFVLLNHVPDFNSVTTMAHEMGHALHSKFSSENQPALYEDYSTATAEVASTFFENFAFDQVFPTLSKKEQIFALHDRIQGSISTVFRQIACFNFEVELHEQIRAKGSLSKEEIAVLLNKHMSSYLGPKVSLTEDDGYFFVFWSHLRNFFYVYSYAFGEIISTALYEMFMSGKINESTIRQFLSAGSNASPEDIFAAAGINVRDDLFFEEGLKKIERDIAKLEELL
ncbi:MAG TPA: M3 family oligoendopeptidase [Candidatus Paceibacterota bacterium]|nr:M3 family oligoendopeptidase [Candidatus Paceibacterota bacterium]